MRAITVIPGKPGSVALTDMPEPPGEDGPILVQTQAIGICGTDLEIINGDYGSAPPGEDRKPEMVRRLGATYFRRGNLGQAAAEADIVIECTGFVQMLLDVGPQHVRHRIICLTGVSAAGVESTVDPGRLNRNMVLQNSVLFGSVNANRDHYELAAQALAQADPGWLADLITRREPLGQWAGAYARQPDDIKTILTFPDE